MVALHSDRLTLRPARAADLLPIHEILRDPIATRYWSTPPHRDLGQTEKWLASMLSTRHDEGEDFVIEFRGETIGKAGFHRFPEIGFILRPDHWRRGFATEALQLIIPRAFSVHGLSRIIADVDPRNESCLRLLSKFGFRETGRAERTWQVGQHLCDSVYLALDAETEKPPSHA